MRIARVGNQTTVLETKSPCWVPDRPCWIPDRQCRKQIELETKRPCWTPKANVGYHIACLKYHFATVIIDLTIAHTYMCECVNVVTWTCVRMK